MLRLTDSEVNGIYKGAVIYDNLNLWNQSQQCVSIASKRLGQIYKACGFDKVKDASELKDIPMTIKVIIQKSTGWGDQNSVKFYSTANSSAYASNGRSNMTDNVPF